MKTVLFLGAGASAFAGCPTTTQLRDLTLDSIRKRLGDPIDGNESNRLRLLEHIVLKPQLDDIEKIYSCVDYMLEAPDRYGDAVLSDMPHTGSGITMVLSSVLDVLYTLRSILRETLLSNFAVNSDYKNDIEKIYSSLFNVVGGASGSVDIITTNYDNVIETYCYQANIRRVDGFVSPINGDHRIWKNAWNVENGSIRLVKLHGSVTWQRRDGEIIGMITPGSRQDDEDVLVEPTLDTKDYRHEPFPQMFKQCDRVLADTDMLVAIGYSFRDDAINRKIIGAINRRMRMLVVSPSAESDVRENLRPDSRLIEGVQPKIDTIEKKFGRDEIVSICERVKAILDGD